MTRTLALFVAICVAILVSATGRVNLHTADVHGRVAAHHVVGIGHVDRAMSRASDLRALSSAVASPHGLVPLNLAALGHRPVATLPSHRTAIHLRL